MIFVSAYPGIGERPEEYRENMVRRWRTNVRGRVKERAQDLIEIQ